MPRHTTKPLTPPPEVEKTPRGDAARHALIMAGLKLFSEYGRSGSSTRELTRLARTNLAAISYYFGSKDGLYIAVVDYIAEELLRRMAPLKADGLALLEQGKAAPEQIIQALHCLLSGMADIFLNSSEVRFWARIVTREMLNPGPAFALFYQRQIKPMHDLITALIILYVPRATAGDAVKIRAHALISQVLVFIISKEPLLRYLGIEELETPQMTQIHQLIHTHIRACLTAALNEEDI